MDTDTPSVIVTTGPAALKYHSGTDLDKTPRFFEVPWHVRVQYPFVKSLHRWNRKAFIGASEVVAINKFDASITAKTFGRNPRIVYLPVDLDGFKVEQPTPSRITLVNPRDRHNGLDTFLKIADQLPNQEFQIAGTLYDKSLTSEVEDRDNVTHLGWCDNMREVYATTKILTIPSMYQEGGNRIIAEAFASGIPVIGSDLGGIPDYVGDGGIVIEDYTDVDAWTAAVQDLIDDQESYDTYSRQARQRAELFELEGRVDEFESILQSVSS
jgi:glycosyltransferase involved in cell wall biosynthesis